MKISVIKHLLKLGASSVLVLVASASMSACNSDSDQNENTTMTTKTVSDNAMQNKKTQLSKDEKVAPDAIITLQGQVLYQAFEGGFFGFVAVNGDKYLPSGLAKEYRKNGLIIEIKAEKMEQLLTFQQFGQNIKVLEVKILDSSKVTSVNEAY